MSKKEEPKLTSVELTDADMNNVYAALVLMSKSNSVDANSMKVLLVLSDKFIIEK